MKLPLPLNVKYCCKAIKLAVEAIVESLHTLLKDVFRNLSPETATWVYLKRHLKKWA